jgi:hypothetical protein
MTLESRKLKYFTTTSQILALFVRLILDLGCSVQAGLGKSERKGHSVEFSIAEIIHTHLGEFSREYVFQFILKFTGEHGNLKLLPKDRVRLTDAGKKYCNSENYRRSQ